MSEAMGIALPADALIAKPLCRAVLIFVPLRISKEVFILKEYRRSGAGKLFFKELNKAAKENKCGRIEFIVLDWNKSAISFYNKLGIKELKGWKFFRKSF